MYTYTKATVKNPLFLTLSLALGDMAQTNMAALILAPKELFSIVFWGVISPENNVISPENTLCYYIPPERTLGYQSGSNSPALRPGIRLPELDPLFVPPNAIKLIPEAAPKHCRRRRGIWIGLLV